jgi:hypothetical protein
MTNEEIQLMFAHAMLVGLAQNGHLLTANASGEDIGKMIATKSHGITRGYTDELEALEEEHGEYT